MSQIIDYDMESDVNNNYKKTEKTINFLLEQLDNAEDKKKRKEIINKINEIKQLLITKRKETNYYPEYEDKKFLQKLLKKKEFNMNKEYKINKKIVQKEFFELTNNQKFIKKLISPNTPYRTLYLYHGVGVGKTCSSIQISHNFRKYYTKKTLVLLPSINLKGNFKKELFDLLKYKKEDDNMEQCLGNYYLHKISNRGSINKTDIKKRVEKIIKNDYEFLGFGEFVNIIDRLKKNSQNYKVLNDKIRKKFDDRVIIVDEIHNMRLISDKEIGKKIPKIFHDVLDKLKNNVLVLLSATPMFNDYKEIKFILNTIKINNKKPKILNKTSIFENEDNNILNEDFKKDLIETASRYISYMRGENPYTFPIRIYPSINNDENILDPKDYPVNDIYGKKIKDKEQIKYLELIKTNMSELQETIYNTINTKEIDEDEDNNIISDNTDLQQRVQVSNIVFPNDRILNNKLDKNFDIKKTYGSIGLKEIVEDLDELKLEYKKDVLDKYGEIFSKSNIDKYSPKIDKIVDYIDNSYGIVLVYSRYIFSGIIPLALCLEHQGYSKYGNKLMKKSKKNNKGKYIIISGNKKLSNNIERELSIVNDEDNQNGEKIKVVIISESGTEGLDFKNIRQIHIMEPWYNMNRIEQIIGRGVRNYSHFHLEDAKRNTTIYHYVNMIKDTNKETVDFRMYRISENKQKKISIIEKIMKENSIDCNLNEEKLSYKNINKTIITSDSGSKLNGKKMIKYDIGDRDYTRMCDYGKCNFKCKTKINLDDTNDNTYDKEILYYDINVMKKYIMEYFKKNNSGSIEILKNEIDTKYYDLIYFALNDLVNNKILFKNNKGRLGYIINRSNLYIFQPKDIEDNKILLKERLNKSKLIPKKIRITELEKPEINKSIKSDKVSNNSNNVISTKKDISTIYKLKYKSLLIELKRDETDTEFIKNNKKYIVDMIIDNLEEKKLLELYADLLNEKIDKDYLDEIKKSLKRAKLLIMDNKDKNKIKSIYNYYNDTFICKVNGKIEICPPNKYNEYKEKLKNKIKKFKNNKEIINNGFIELKDGEILNKIIDLDKKDEKKNVTGTVCLKTSTINKSKIIKFIGIYDKQREYTTINKNNELVLKDKDTKKINLCTIYQLLLRKRNHFSRPLIYIMEV